MRERFTNKLYTTEIRVFRDHQFHIVESDDGTLFSKHYRTKILPEDLPEWYVFGRYYKLWGYMSTKGITDMRYVPNKTVNHFLKDDSLYISYGGVIEDAPASDTSYYNRYIGYDEVVWGREIISILRGAQKYSNYDISSFVQSIKDKKEWLIYEYPDEFGPHRWSFDVERSFAQPFSNGRPDPLYSISLVTDSLGIAPAARQYIGSLDEITVFIDTLDNTKRLNDSPKPLSTIKHAFLYTGNKEVEFKTKTGLGYCVRIKSAYANAVIVKDGEQYLRCIRPVIEGISCRRTGFDETAWQNVNELCTIRGVLMQGKDKPDSILCALYLPERQYSNVKLAVAGLNSDGICLDAVWEELFADE